MALARTWSVGAGRGPRARGRGRGRHVRPGLPAVRAGRAARRGAAAVDRPGPGGDGQLRAATSPAAHHHRAVAGEPCPSRERLRPRAGRGLLAAGGVVEQRSLDGTCCSASSALDGSVRPVRGVLPCLLAAAHGRSCARSWCPSRRRRGRAGRRASTCSAAGSLAAVVGATCRPDGAAGRRAPVSPPDGAGRRPRRRRRAARRPAALEIAAAGGHHLLLAGPPGTGKTMLAHRLVGLLPRLDRRRGAGGSPRSARWPAAAGRRRASTRAAVRGAAPLRSMAALVGGGTGLIRPVRSRWPIAACFSSTRRPNVPRACSTRCAQPLEEGEIRLSPAPRARSATRPASSCCWPPTRARAPPRTTATACARR